MDKLKEQLIRRYENLKTAGDRNLGKRIRTFWSWLQQQPILVEALNYAKQTFDPDDENSDDSELRLIIDCIEEINYWMGGKTFDLEYEMADLININYKSYTIRDAISIYVAEYIGPVVFYLEEYIHQVQYEINILLRYKRTVEWFDRKRLMDQIEAIEKDVNKSKEELEELNNQKSPAKKIKAVKKRIKNFEVTLAKDLYRFCYTSGMDFSIEEQCAIGEADFIAEEFILDVKVVKYKDKAKGSINTTLIRKAFHQVYRYVDHYQRSTGYVFIYNPTPRPLKFDFEDQTLGVPYITINHKRIYVIEVDLGQVSASNSGKLKPSHITEDSVIEYVANEETKCQQKPS